MKHLALIACLIAPLPLSAEVQQFAKGQFLSLTARYDADTDRFLPDVYEGERNICLRVDKVAKEGVTLTLVKGIMRPWWDHDVAFKPGEYSEVWSTSDAYRKNHPKADAIIGLLGMFTAHPTCP